MKVLGKVEWQENTIYLEDNREAAGREEKTHVGRVI